MDTQEAYVEWQKLIKRAATGEYKELVVNPELLLTVDLVLSKAVQVVIELQTKVLTQGQIDRSTAAQDTFNELMNRLKGS